MMLETPLEEIRVRDKEVKEMQQTLLAMRIMIILVLVVKKMEMGMEVLVHLGVIHLQVVLVVFLMQNI